MNLLSKTLLFPVMLLLFSACAYNNSSKGGVTTTLTGMFSPYHTAFGAGRGIIFRVPIPNNVKERYTIDSFYLNGKAHAFILSTMLDTMYLEATYFVSKPTPSVGATVAEQMDSAMERSNREILVERNFYPSWIVCSGKKGPIRLDILNYQEIFASTKQQ
jgi:hypothetical protein